MEEVFVPIALFATLPLTVWAVSHFRSKNHLHATHVMEKMVEKGEPLTPEIIKSLGIKARQPDSDLRTGLILVAIAIATILMGAAIPDEDGTKVMTGIAMFPLIVGAAYIGIWTFISRKYETK